MANIVDPLTITLSVAWGQEVDEDPFEFCGLSGIEGGIGAGRLVFELDT